MHEVRGVVAKAKGEMNVSTSNDETTFTLAHFHGVTARVVTRAASVCAPRGARAT